MLGFIQGRIYGAVVADVDEETGEGRERTVGSERGKEMFLFSCG